MYTVIPLDQFTNENIWAYHGAALHRYARLRVEGHRAYAAFTASFKPEYATDALASTAIDLIETSDVYAKLKEAYAADQAKKRKSMWDAQSAARVLVSIATDEGAKRAERIAAAKELNVLYGITIIDDKGNTRSAGHSIDDFYRIVDEHKAAAGKAH